VTIQPDNQNTYAARQQDGVTIVTLDANSLDYRNAETYKTALANLCSSGQTKILLNLERVSFMDSAGLGVLLFGKRQCENNQGKLSVCNVQGYVNNLFRLTNLDRAMAVYTSEELALTAAKRDALTV
jgi:anti-anti-sigma factor